MRYGWLFGHGGRWLRAAALLGLGVVAGGSGLGKMWADPPAGPAPAPAATPSEYGQRVVAYIYGNVPITREDLGEYLIARQGPEKLDLLVNLRIIELACKKAGITVTPEEVEAGLLEDLQGYGPGVSRADFLNKILKAYGKTEVEWKEDVIRPRILLSKLCQEKVQVTDDDLKQRFECLYGKKVKCRMIMVPQGPGRQAQEVYARARQSAEAFEREARQQANPTLAGAGGDIAPISRYMPGNSDLIEKEAFALNPGELSRLIETKEACFILRCDAHLPADASKNFEQEKEKLRKEVFDQKLQKVIPQVFQAMREQANPILVLKPGDKPTDTVREVERMIGVPPGSAPATGAPTTPPAPGGLQPVGYTAPPQR
jgi:hypothetical protein